MVRAIAEAMFSEDGEVESEHLDAHVDEVEAFIAATSKTTRVGLWAALLLVRLSPILFFVRLTTLERLAISKRSALLTRLERSTRTTLSLAFVAWRTIMTLVFYEDESELRALGYRTERERYKRALPMLPPAHVLQVPLESGVRLRDSDQTPLPARLPRFVVPDGVREHDRVATSAATGLKNRDVA